MPRAVTLSIALALAAAPMFAQRTERSFRTPTLGFVWDASQNQIRPIVGMAGASYLGTAAALGITPARALFPPQHDYALLLDSDTQTWTVYRPETGLLDRDSASSMSSLAKGIVFSPDGRTLAAQEGDSLRILGQLPGKASARALDLPAGLTLLAVSDTGAAALIDGNGAGYFATAAGVQPIGADGALSAASFQLGSDDLALADSVGNRLLLRRASGEVSVLAGAGDGVDRPQAVDFLDDGQRLVLLQGQPARVSLLALDGSGFTDVPCGCAVSSLTRLAGRSVFQLQPGGAGPIWLLDASKSNARTLFIGAGPALSQASQIDGGNAQ